MDSTPKFSLTKSCWTNLVEGSLHEADSSNVKKLGHFKCKTTLPISLDIFLVDLRIKAMFVRVKRSVQNSRTYEYLQIVESFRDTGKPRQRVIASLGRRDMVVASGVIDGLLRSLGKFSERLRVVEAVRTRGLVARTSKSWGPALIFSRLWENQGLPEILCHLARDRKFGFEPGRVAFALALQRLCCPGSDLQGSEWVRTVQAEGFEQIALQHLYRTSRFLAEIRDELKMKVVSAGGSRPRPCTRGVQTLCAFLL